ncbi:MAG: alpha/beta hydrolase [Gemmataceae bacterium]|nr:alpha/beta hydrolase [Gemmataceae bacterium]
MNTRALPWPLCPIALLIAFSVHTPIARADEAPAKTYDVKIVRDVAYYEGEDADKIKHKLDLFLPRDLKDFPMLFFVHGGAWMSGDKSQFGIYSTFGMRMAKLGIGVVTTNYRLSPKVQHPEHIKDVARAFAWTHKNIAKHGGNPNQMFVCGHSAGGHLVALLSTDESYLKAEKLSLKAIKGAMPVSGVMEIEADILPNVFGKDPEVRKKASPICHVRDGIPPFLVIYADSDLPVCAKTSISFCKVLQEKKCTFEELQVAKRNHLTILLNANVDGDPVAEALLKFIDKYKGS